MKNSDIVIRDPFVLLSDGTYYLYGTRSKTTWGPADGFDVYKGTDLENWEGPIEIFHRPEGFWADRCYWAPECIEYKGAFYLITTLGAKDRKKGIYILRSDSPEGPFTMYSGRLTPEDWTCIDGTVYIHEGHIYLVFSHSFEDTPDGDMDYVELSEDLTGAITPPKTLFKAPEAKWAHPVPFAKAEFGMDGDVYFTDGPFLFEMNDKLWMTWSSWGTNGYAVGLAYSDNGRIDGRWIQTEQPFFPENGGHGMAFRDKEGNLKYTLHYPNDFYKEHPVFMNLVVD
ncbi:MAG: family 43 glycosylhydrolase [Parasporobacterium sp.]|nr:family 43 glycosylhydrolase [Parasporobacterium sp.]